MHLYCNQCGRYCTFPPLLFIRLKSLRQEFRINHTSLVFIDADSDSWTTAFVNKWLQSDFNPASAAKMLHPSADPAA